MSGNVNIDIRIPKGWREISGRQAQIIISLIFLASGISREEALLIAALRTSGISLISTSKDGALLFIPKKYTSSHKSITSEIPYGRLRLLVSEIAWCLDMPDIPWRPSRLMGRTPIKADLSSAPLGTYLEADALYQGYITHKNQDMLDALARLLVPSASRNPVPWERQAVLIWFASLKSHLAIKFPDLFKPIAGKNSGNLAKANSSIQKNFDAMLRALTKGDPLKEDAVLQLPLYRALTELNAQAAEYERIRQIQKK